MPYSIQLSFSETMARVHINFHAKINASFILNCFQRLKHRRTTNYIKNISLINLTIKPKGQILKKISLRFKLRLNLNQINLYIIIKHKSHTYIYVTYSSSI